MNTVFIKTYGCSLNSADSERIAGILKLAGFKIVDAEKQAEVVIINSCTVKCPTVNKIKRYVKELDEMGKKIVIAGCLPQAQDELFNEYSLIGPSQLENIVPVVEETMHGHIVKMLVAEKDTKINMPTIRSNDIIEIVPICQGCLGEPCSYCIVKKARGNLRSYSIEAIYEKVKKAVIKDRVREVWLTAQDAGCYGYDIDTNIVELLNKVLTIKGNFKIRLGMANPDHVKDHIDELIEVFKNEKMFKFLHLPIQSGNNEVLKVMKRKYTVKQFVDIVDRFRKEIPMMTIATDVICGFPTETDKQFNDTLDLIKKVNPDVVNVSKYWRQPHTKAYDMEQVPGDVIKVRSGKLTSVFQWNQHELNKRWVGRECEVIVDELGKNGSLIGHNEYYKNVILHDDVEIGDRLIVKIVKAHGHDIFGEVLKRL